MNVSATIQGETARRAVRAGVRRQPGQHGAAACRRLAEDGVTVADPAQAEERPVVLGINDSVYIQVTSGLEEGDTVLVQNTEMGG